ncbi:uncharacterized protein PV06_07614 [Exophiala oligosperma]|uniref:Mitochondrial inner membrane protease ATP23 n=1 Tax=Exophiala oligosperma TaxID=215243 RepID=A0A0D2DD97_9EURO|nr:uncharacterized protein PV06_07614 [Exophiala oligosperma]KIW40410.1 hypothetical protein PV06_07614 [Exophiala oligosperma]
MTATDHPSSSSASLANAAQPPTSVSSSGASPGAKGHTLLPSDTIWNRWVNFYRMARRTMSEQGAEEYWKDADQRYSKIDCARCDTWRNELFRTSPVITYLNDNIRKLGGDLGPENIRCRTCSEKMLAGFDQQYGIKICANRIESKSMMEDVLAHEMVHAYDHLRFKADQVGNLRHAACTEIRASNLSGECRWANEFFGNKIMSFTNHQQDCVRRRAINSVKARPGCKDEAHAEKVVNEVWDSCFRDTRPFDEVYR